MEITNYREANPAEKFVAKFDIYIPALQLTLRNLKLILSKKGHHFLSFPSFCEEDFTGEKKFTPYIEFSKEKGQEFQREVMKLLEPFFRK